MEAQDLDDSFMMNEVAIKKLLGLYKRKESLWNPTHPHFNDEDVRFEEIVRITRAMDLPGLEPRHVSYKLKSYRDMYSYMKKSDDAGSQPYWMKEMEFLDALETEPVEEIRVKIEEIEDPLPDSGEATLTVKIKQDPDLTIDTEESNIGSLTTEDENNAATAAEPQAAQIKLLVEKKKPKRHSKRRKLDKDQAEIEDLSISNLCNDIFSCIEANQAKILKLLESQQTQELKNEVNKNFGRYVASLLSELPEVTAVELQMKIIDLINRHK